jgi:hypothetical protein
MRTTEKTLFQLSVALFSKLCGSLCNLYND